MDSEECDYSSDSEFINKLKKKRGKYFQNYTEDDIKNAIQKVCEGMRLAEAADTFNVPKKTLWNRINNKSSSRHGFEAVLGKQVEEYLAKWIVHWKSKGNPRTKNQILEAASRLSQLNPDFKKRFKHGKPSSKWLRNFLRRHAEAGAWKKKNTDDENNIPNIPSLPPSLSPPPSLPVILSELTQDLEKLERACIAEHREELIFNVKIMQQQVDLVKKSIDPLIDTMQDDSYLFLQEKDTENP
ncbi:CLUMA_CG004891, isoform A [Clunio marinus]|uniref:CLUMA_CG004891, isoform A n=1 Tax=Clunio marinus TaxID=568069 RepID=A0A1J1HT15_9DIPT|nr:CLUMA_CG004891, isoform A [Clunio marinus]